MINKLSKNFLIYTISLILIFFIFTVIGFNYTSFMHDLESKQLEEYSNVYLDSLESIRYNILYYGYNVVEIKTTLYISFLVISSFIALQIVLTSILVLRFKYKRIYALIKLVNFFMTAIIITFVFVILFNYINNIELLKKH